MMSTTNMKLCFSTNYMISKVFFPWSACGLAVGRVSRRKLLFSANHKDGDAVDQVEGELEADLCVEGGHKLREEQVDLDSQELRLKVDDGVSPEYHAEKVLLADALCTIVHLVILLY